jgi:hypothetical protein
MITLSIYKKTIKQCGDIRNLHKAVKTLCQSVEHRDKEGQKDRDRYRVPELDGMDGWQDLGFNRFLNPVINKLGQGTCPFVPKNGRCRGTVNSCILMKK